MTSTFVGWLANACRRGMHTMAVNRLADRGGRLAGRRPSRILPTTLCRPAAKGPAKHPAHPVIERRRRRHARRHWPTTSAGLVCGLAAEQPTPEDLLLAVAQ
jgi:hypothetical protein